MNSLVNAITALILLGTAPVLAQSDVKEQLSVPLTDPGKPGSMEVSLINGSIHVVGYNGKEVVIDATSDSGRHGRNEERSTSRNSESGGMRRIQMNNPFELSAEERNNRVRVNANSIRTPVVLTIKVPQRFSLKLHTVNNGDITVDNVNGELEVNNVNGAIELTNVSGSAVANTVNGNLIAAFRDIDDNKPMAFSTLNGKVDVTFPSSVKASVKMKSDRGDIFSDFDIDVEKSQPKASRSSQGGMYRVTIEDWVYGKINGGGPEVMMKSMQGNIYVRKGK